jgi:sn-glycerol 3-phosphate transport system substrate-binding protein
VLEPLDDYEGARAIPFVPELEQRGTFAGSDGQPLVAIPFNRSTPIAFANARVLDDERAAMPRTWDELAGVARRPTKTAANGETRWG